MTDRDEPKISVVTPSFNQGQFLEETILSVLNQHYENLEYIIIDGGSSDNSLDIIEKYEDDIDYWVSEPDNGQYDAINKGFKKSTGDIMAWINSDDKYTPYAFSVVADIFSISPEIEWITSLYPVVWNINGQPVYCGSYDGFEKISFFKGANLEIENSYVRSFIQQESTFWKRSLWDRSGGYLDSGFHSAGDFELWARFFNHAQLYGVYSLLGGFRKHENQKTSQNLALYLEEAESVLKKYNYKTYGKFSRKMRNALNVFQVANIGNSKLPKVLNDFAVSTQILYPAKVCKWNGTGWEIETNYVI